MAIISVRNLNKSFLYNEIFKDVSFHLEKGDKIGLIGQNGAGKTTLFNILTNEVESDSGDIFIGKNISISHLKQHVRISSDNTVLKECKSIFADVFQLESSIRDLELKIADASQSLEELNILLEEYGRMTEEFHNVDGFSIDSRVVGVLKGLGFSEEEFNMQVNNLSGGQKSRLHLAKLLLTNPDLMLLDEPTNHLDIDTISWLERYLKDYNGTLIVISHDRFFLDNVVNRIFLLENTKLTTYDGNYTNYMAARKIELEILNRQYENQQTEIAIQQKIIDRFLSVGREKAIRQGLSRQKQLEKIELLDPIKTTSTANIKFTTSIKTGHDIFIAEDLSKSFGEKKIFENIDFQFYKGDRVGLVGKNGVGKTTLFKIISDEISSDTGKLQRGSNVIIGYFDQEMAGLDPENTVIEEIWDAYPKLTHFQVRSYLAKMMFVGENILKEIKFLSGGEKARISLLKLMLSNANVLLMDEPTNHLDIDSKEILEDALRDYEGSVISISHDRYFLNNFANKIWDMTSSSITEYLGNYDYFSEKKAELSRPEELYDYVTKTEKKNAHKKVKAIEDEERKQKKAMNELLESIERLEAEVSELEDKMADPELSKDYQRVMDLDLLRVSKQNELEILYEKWMELE